MGSKDSANVMPDKHSLTIPFAPDAFQKAVLTWYDVARRDLPWRAKPGQTASPYRVWLSEIMLQQTTVKAVIPYFETFVARWPTVEELGAAPRDDVLAAWAGLGYYSRARNLHACAQAVARSGFPENEAGLRELPGIGAYTAAAIAAIAFGQRAAAVDGNVERVIARLLALGAPLPSSKPLIRKLAARLTPESRPGDYAQAMMDLGATVCIPRSPRCQDCAVRSFCSAATEGQPERYPVKPPKAARPSRRGDAFVMVKTLNGRTHILLRRRPDKGLLGGMMEVPGTDWVAIGETARESSPSPRPSPRGERGKGLRPFSPNGEGISSVLSPLGERDRVRGSCGLPISKTGFNAVELDWIEAHAVQHTFTHFHLDLRIFAAAVPGGADGFGGEWAPLEELARFALPTVMKKAVAAGLRALKIEDRGGSHAAGKAARSASRVSRVERSAIPSTRAGRK